MFLQGKAFKRVQAQYKKKMARKVFLTALGGAEEVGRSSFLLDAGEKILLDSGLKLAPNKIEHPLELTAHPDGIVISHAHLDHSGHLPHIFLESRPKVYMTPPTLDLSKILWQDTLKIADSEGNDPPFTQEEIHSAEQFTFQIGYKRKIGISNNVSLEFYDAGHICGSAMSKIFLPEKNILYTGDYKVKETRLHQGADLNVGKVDTVILEGTYGDREQDDREETEKYFIERVSEVLAEGGNVVVPAFSIGRTQEILVLLYEYKIGAQIFLDGMGQKAAAAMLRHPSYLKNPRHLKTVLDKVKWVQNSRKTRKTALTQSSIIVSSAGMLQGGPAISYISKLHNDPKSAVFLTGYQAEQTPGKILLETGKLKADGRTLDVKMQIERFDFSAHPSQSELFKSLKKWGPEKAVLVHGDKNTLPIFKKEIESQLGIEAIIPKLGKETEI